MKQFKVGDKVQFVSTEEMKKILIEKKDSESFKTLAGKNAIITGTRKMGRLIYYYTDITERVAFLKDWFIIQTKGMELE